MAVYLLDSNYLINGFDPNKPKEVREAILQKLADKLREGESRLVITPLIRYEALRNVDWEDSERFEKMVQSLQLFDTLDITREVADLACDLYRFDVFQAEQKNENGKRNFEKRKFDIFHFATAKVNDLQMLSEDSDVGKIEKLYADMVRINR